MCIAAMRCAIMAVGELEWSDLFPLELPLGVLLDPLLPLRVASLPVFVRLGGSVVLVRVQARVVGLALVGLALALPEVGSASGFLRGLGGVLRLPIAKLVCFA
jgi:hypothetical protein